MPRHHSFEDSCSHSVGKRVPTSIQSNRNKNQISHNIQQFRLQKNSNLPWSTSSTTTTTIDIIQINLAKSKVATAHLAKLASEININHFLVQEPYVKEGPVNLISAYSSPYSELEDTAQDLANILTKIGPEQALIGADMNAPSTLWGYANNSSRGNVMEDLISGLSLHLLNEKNSEPTFQHGNAKGWPDLALVK
ncbi:hypothetical protein AVEN_186247-1 [Araneus ventricosus]|uniref:Endonuclease/exonuclease/phosphatase domain-containing protein n=1 Tax=Araneus ventricosus TaxID=182803 RepID=A0A4Y2NFW8_ARAVE|nr:hypothetical protein AVEN_186247-1 [Araneus ventricosus]